MSVRHIVFLHLLETTSHHDTRLRAAISAEADLIAQAPGGEHWKFGLNRSQQPGAPEYVGVGDFASLETLSDFLAHPAHATATRLWQPLAKFTVADLEI